MRPIGIVGNVARDRVEGSRPRVGGGPYHCGRALRALGRRGVIATKSSEHDRRDLLTPLVCLGLPVLWRPAEATSGFSMTYDGDARQMVVDEVGPVWTPEDARGWAGKALADVEWLHVAPLARSDFPADTIAALARGRRLSYDAHGLVRRPRTGPLTLDAEYDPDVLRPVSVLKLADEEAELLVGSREEGALRSLGVPEIVVTFGSRGAVVLAHGRMERVQARAVPGAVDPTGAGDAFAAAYVAARAGGQSPWAAADRASALVADLLAGRLR